MRPRPVLWNRSGRLRVSRCHLQKHMHKACTASCDPLQQPPPAVLSPPLLVSLTAAAHAPAAARLLRARLSQESQRSPSRVEGTWHGPSTAPAAPSPFAAAAAASGSPQGAAAASVGSGSPPPGEGLLLGPSAKRAASINIAILSQQQALLARQAEQQAAAMTRAASTIDRSWHAGGVSGAEAPRADFQQFLEQAKKQRQEQRKVARLVLESSTHGTRRYPDQAAGSNGLNGLSDGAQEGSKHGGLLGAVRGMLHSVSGVFKREGGTKSPEGSRRGNSLLPMPASSRRSSLLPTPGGGSRGGPAATAVASSPQSPAGTPLPTTGSTTPAAAAAGVSSIVRPGQSLLPMPASSNKPTPTGGRHALLPVPGGSSRPAAGVAAQPPPPPAVAAAGGPVGVPVPGSRQPLAAAAASAHTPASSPAAGGLSHAPIPLDMVATTAPGAEAVQLEQGKRGQGAYAALMAAAGGSEASIPPADSAAESKPRSTVKQVGFAEAPTIRTISRTSRTPPEVSGDNNVQTSTPTAGTAELAHAHSLAAKLQAVEASGGATGAAAAPLQDVRQVLQQMFAGEHDLLTVEQLQARLEGLGHRLAPSEVAHLARQVGLGDGDVVGLSQFAASQLEWGDMQVGAGRPCRGSMKGMG